MPGLEAFTPEEQTQFDAMQKGEAPVETTPTPETTPAVAATTPAVEDDGDDLKPDKSGMVPHGRFHEQLKKRKAAEKERDDLRSTLAKGQGRLETLESLIRAEQQRASQKPAEPVQIPDVNVDPVGHFRAENAALKQQLSEIAQWRQTQEQQTTVQTNVQRIAQIAGGHEAEFKKTNPDYEEASTYLRNLEDVRLQSLGVSDPMQRAQMINKTALEIAVAALNGGKNAADTVYTMAKGMGWKPKAAQSTPQTPAKSPGQEKIEMAAKGQQQGGGIGSANGSAAPEMTLEALANMPEDEFAKLTSGKNWAKIMTSAKAR